MVSNQGRVKSLDRYVPHKNFGKMFVRGHIMSTHLCNSGYVTVNLCKGNRYKSHSVHRIVMAAFAPTSNACELEVNHKDENKQNNCVSNLEWVTKTENEAWGTKRTRQADKIKIPVIQCDTNGNFIREWPSATDAEIAISGKATGAVSHNINGATKSAFGHIWKFKEVT